jgi:AcrR family transcriptional regulator
VRKELPERLTPDRHPIKENILALADRLIRRRGFNAFSYADIAGVMEVCNAAVHYHFPTKSDLGQAVVEKEMERLRQYRWRTADGSGEEQLKSLVSVFFRNSQLDNICLMGSLLPDFATFTPDMQEKVREMCKVLLDWVADSLERARKERKVRFKGPAADRAALVLSTLLSSLLLARVSGQAVFRQMVDRLLEDLGAAWRVGELSGPAWPYEESASFT